MDRRERRAITCAAHVEGIAGVLTGALVYGAALGAGSSPLGALHQLGDVVRRIKEERDRYTKDGRYYNAWDAIYQEWSSSLEEYQRQAQAVLARIPAGGPPGASTVPNSPAAT